MSLWNRIGEVASTVSKNAVKFGGEVFGAATAPARFAWDVATAPWNDDKEYNGFVNTFKSAGEDATSRVVKPLASAGGAIMKVPGVATTFEKINEINQEYIREPLTTYELVQGEVNKTGPLAFFDPEVWRKAYKGAQDISFGQAFVGAQRMSYDPKFNIYDPAQREAAFKKSAWGKYTSGALDLGVQFFGDVTLAAGKAVKVIKASELGVGMLKNADAVAQAAEDITKAQYGVENRFTKVLEDFTNNDSAYAINHPMVKSSSQPGLLAYMLGQSKTVDETSLVLRSALGDPHAMDELASVRIDLTDALKASRGDLSAVDEFKLFGAPEGSGMLPFLNDSMPVIKEAEDNYKALAQADNYFAKLMQLGEGGGSLTRTTGKLGQGVEDLIAQGRATKFYDKSTGSAKVEAFQPTPFHRLYQKVSWAEQERPSGLVDFNDADSYKEVLATVNQTQKLLGYTPEQSRELLDSYMKASTPGERALATQNMENKVFRDLCAKYGIDEDKATEIYNSYTGARTSAMKSIQDKGFMVDTDGSIIKVPQLESQMADYLPVMDFALMNKILKREGNALRAVVGQGKDLGIHYADVMQDAFKAGALLRLGYTIRNGVDSQLRMISAVGAINSLSNLGPGLKNLVYNTVKEPARLIDRYRKVDSGRTLAEINEQSTKLVASLDVLKAKIGELEAKASLYPDDPEIATELNTMRQLRAEKLDIYNHNAAVIARSKNATPKQQIGTGSFEVTTADGETYILDDAFGGPLGEMFRRVASSGNSFERMVDSNSDLYARTIASKGIQAIRPTDKAYFEQWAQTLRQQFGNSEVVRQIAAGKSLEDITNWLIASPKGRDLRRELSISSADAPEYVTRISNFLDQYLPVESGLRGKLRDLTADDLRTTFTDPSELPIIHGHLLQDTVFNASDKHIKKAINGAFKLLGTMPEDAWARSPLYKYYYREELKRRIDITAGLKEDGRLTVEEQAKAMAAARKVALRNMKSVLFNIERRTNLAAAMKYISPFFSAQENAYKTWLKLVAANPAIANRAYNIWQAPNRAGLVTDYEGNPVPAGKTTGNDIMWFELPKGLTRLPGLNSLTQFGIPKGSLDIIFQGGMDAFFNKGNPNFASDILPVGPYIAIPISEIVKNQPSLEDSFKWALPFGTYKNAAAGLLPSWLQKQLTKTAGQSDPQFAKSYQLIYETEKQKMVEAGLGDKVDPKKIMDMTKQYWNMRSAANLLMPFAPQFNSPYKFYLDKSREYRRIYGVNADAKFLNDYPDFFDFTTTLSKNPTGVQSSLTAVRNLKEHAGLVSDLVKIDPKLVGLIANDPNGYDFSQAAYNYLYEKQISPDSPDKFLSSQSPAEAQMKTDAEKGWIKYNQFMDIIDDELKNRGLTSIQQKGAEDLASIKTAMINKLSVVTDAEGKPVYNEKTGTYKYTPWYQDYLDSDGSKTNRVIEGLNKILSDKKFIEKNGDLPTWKSVNTYIQFRKIIAGELARRDIKTIDAKANTDLKFIYDSVVKKLKDDDKMGFAYVYDRFLSQDLLFDKYLTPKGSK